MKKIRRTTYYPEAGDLVSGYTPPKLCVITNFYWSSEGTEFAHLRLDDSSCILSCGSVGTKDLRWDTQKKVWIVE